MNMLDYKLIKCPKCGKMHFVKSGYDNGYGSSFDLFSGIGISDSVYRKEPQPVYLNGELQNPEDFVPNPTKDYFECLECGCNFYIKTTWKYVGGDVNYAESYKIVDKDKEDAKRTAAIKKHWEEIEKEQEKAKNINSHVGESLTICDDISTISAYSPRITTINCTLGNGDKSEIDMGGVILKSTITYTDEQIKNIKDYFGWEAKNNE